MNREIVIGYEATNDPRAVRIAFTYRGRPWLRSTVRSSGPTLRPSGDALLCFGLLPAIELGHPLRIEAPVDRGLLAAADRVQRLVAAWSPGCRPVPITATATQSTYPEGRGHGVFFSGGVDSAYSLADNLGVLDGIVTVRGCDVSLADRGNADRLALLTRRVASAYGLEPIVIDTDLPERMHPYLGWIEYHGAALAGLRHLLADRFETMRIAASADAATIWDTPWGSHPGIDPELGTAGAAILLDGLVTRPAKIARLFAEPVLLENLRVCFHGGPNCGRCSKCLMTRICLDVLGDGRLPTSFPPGPAPLDRDALAIFDTSVRNERLALREAALRAGGHGPLVAAIDAALARFAGRRPTLAERLRLKERLRVARHRRRFRRDRRRQPAERHDPWGSDRQR